MKYYFLLLFVPILVTPAYGAQNILSDSNIEVDINYPDVETQGNEFVLSTVVKTTVDQVSNITVAVSAPGAEITQNQFHIPNLPKDSTLGNDFNLRIKPGTPDGLFLANIEVDYFVKGFFDQKPVKYILTKAIEINVQSKPSLMLGIEAPDDVFAGEPFTIKGTIKNQGSNAQNIQIVADSSQIQLYGKKIFH